MLDISHKYADYLIDSHTDEEAKFSRNNMSFGLNRKGKNNRWILYEMIHIQFI